MAGQQSPSAQIYGPFFIIFFFFVHRPPLLWKSPNLAFATPSLIGGGGELMHSRCIKKPMGDLVMPPHEILVGNPGDGA